MFDESLLSVKKLAPEYTEQHFRTLNAGYCCLTMFERVIRSCSQYTNTVYVYVQLVEHRSVVREVVIRFLAVLTLRVVK
jgi:hypothetical protein